MLLDCNWFLPPERDLLVWCLASTEEEGGRPVKAPEVLRRGRGEKSEEGM